MSWTLNPTRRNDISLELYEVLDGSGNFTSSWLETVDIYTIRVACSFNGGSPAVRIDEGQFDTGASGDPRVIRSQTVTVASNRGYAELDLTARYFRLVVSGGLADNPFSATVRVV